MSAASLTCKIEEILRRITPIEYCNTCIPDGNCHSRNGTLIIDSNVFIYGQLSFLTCDGSAVGTTINGDGINTVSLNANTGYIHNLTVDHISGGGFVIDVLEEFLPGNIDWPNTLVETTILEIDIPTTGVWQAIAKLSLTNDNEFINLYSVTYGINTFFLSANYYTPMAPNQDVSFEFIQVFKVTTLPFLLEFKITLDYENVPNTGYIDVNRTSFTAVRLGDVA